MSHGGSRGERNNRYVPRNSHQKFVSGSQKSTPLDPYPDPSPKSTHLSSLLRQPDSPAASSRAGSSASGSRIKMGEKGQWVPSRTPAQGGGAFVNYLPQDEAVAAGLVANDGGLDPTESQRVVDLLSRELSRLLKLGAREFWKQVASDASLLYFLDSFLQFRSRWYDFPYHGAKGTVAGVIVGELELSRRVFMVLYRISSNKDPGARAADSLSLKDHEALLQEKNLLDLPKLLDICAIYGHSNGELTKSLVANALRAQPWIHDNFFTMLSHFLGILHTMNQRCSSSMESMLSTGKSGGRGSSQLRDDLLEVLDFINDGVVSLDAFVSAYNPAAVFFSCPVETSSGTEELLRTLAQLHDSLFPSIQKGFQVLFTDGGDETNSDIVTCLKLISARIVNFGGKLLDLCYLSDEVFRDGSPIPAVTKMFPARVEDPTIRADILVQTFREIGDIAELENRNRFLQKLERNFQLIDKLRSLQDAGWIIMDDEQLQYLSTIMMHSAKSSSAKGQLLLPAPTSNTKEPADEDAVVMQSKISQIKDLFPDYGNGYLAACLEVYNQNPEEVIQRILEGTLHEDLKHLDTSLEIMPQPKAASTLSSKDKGKGKLVETTITPPVQNVEQQMKKLSIPAATSSSSTSSTASATTGRFVRKAKDDAPDHKTLDSRNEKDIARNAALLSQYEYEDEYDDSFDDLGLSVGDSRLEESEIFGDKTGTTESPASSASKWGSRSKPQFYVKDGKNYSYKVTGAVAVANSSEARLVNEAQGELIHGLGRGGNLPLGAVKKLTEYKDEQDKPSNSEGIETVKNHGNRSWVRGGRGTPRVSHGEQNTTVAEGSEMQGDGDMGSNRGRGRGRRGGGGGGRNNYRKDRAMKKHMSGLSGF